MAGWGIGDFHNPPRIAPRPARCLDTCLIRISHGLGPTRQRFGEGKVHTVLRAVLMVLLAFGGVTGAKAADDAVFQVRMLPASAVDASVETVASGALDDQLETFEYFAIRRHADAFWLKLEAVQDFAPPGVASLNVRKGRHLDVQVFALD